LFSIGWTHAAGRAITDHQHPGKCFFELANMICVGYCGAHEEPLPLHGTSGIIVGPYRLRMHPALTRTRL
jgi:hypothetical protein